VEFSSVNSYGRHPSLQPSYVFSASELPSSGSSGSIVRIRWLAAYFSQHCGPHTVKHKCEIATVAIVGPGQCILSLTDVI
jgi:hypothetical protein